MIIGHKFIKLFLKLGWIYCDPAPRVITEDSLDVTLGRNFWVLKDGLVGDVIDPCAPAIKHFDLITEDYLKLDPAYWAVGDAMLSNGRGMVIGHTEEFVGSTVPFIVPQIRSRSTFARWGGEVGTAALFGEGGFHSRWALELHNTTWKPLLVYAGWRVGQVIFSWAVGGGLYKRQYNQPKSSWTPEVLLPKAMN